MRGDYLCLLRALRFSGSAWGNRASQQAPEGGQEYWDQSQGHWGRKASSIAEVVLATGGGRCMLGVAIIHGLKAAGYARLPHFHPVRGEVYRGQDTRL